MAPSSTPFSNAILAPPRLSDRFDAFNKIHSVAKQISTDLFRIDIPRLDTKIMSTHTMCLYLDYNVELCNSDSLPNIVPTYYLNFAQAMNDHDDSGFGWAYLDETSASKTIVWDDAWSIADPTAFCILDHEVHSRYLAEGDVSITQTYYENAERLLHLEQQREATMDQATAAGSRAALEAFAKKRKLMLDAADGARASGKTPNAVAGPSGANRGATSTTNPDEMDV
ncbi:hypothetical protein DFH07DRAFT_959269 [Mycena maculata]|uniref:Uncharacterized protein n=1 Tax=Mycena maculata TaxID=230809 RepID=A0AAD7NDF8_9AGAR|nr:hypothetical protein DFH07DRAFT_959269 [Mycena maculata]